MPPSRVAVVTGANKGIGLAIGTQPPPLPSNPTTPKLTPPSPFPVRQLALQYPQSSFNNGPLLIYLTARNPERGENALAALHQDAQLHSAKALAPDGGLASIQHHTLDIAQPASIAAFAAFLQAQHPHGIDFVINNAGIALTGFGAPPRLPLACKLLFADQPPPPPLDSTVVHETLQCNYYGTLGTTQALLPLLRPAGRLVNVSSMAGHLDKYSPALRARFRAAASVADVTALMEDFRAAVAAGEERAQGWPSAAYAVSKAGLTAVTGVLAREERERGRGVLVNSCCPGYVRTDMTRGSFGRGRGWWSGEGCGVEGGLGKDWDVRRRWSG
ncbi:hypothetical protein MMC32_002880 [Xylographa parallela]|nr:hypothetical protein [Xylographa parallela]